MKIFFIWILLLSFISAPAFASPETKYKNRFKDMTRQEPLGETGLFIVDSLSLYAWTWAWTLAIQPDLRNAMTHPSWSRWGDRISRAPVWNDGNGFVVNNIFHPLAGAFYYEYLRARDHPCWLSAAGTFLQSLLFEYTIEGQYTVPSAQDLVKTTGLGVPLGMLFDHFSRKWLIDGSKKKKWKGYVLNPMYLLPWARWKPDSQGGLAAGVVFKAEF